MYENESFEFAGCKVIKMAEGNIFMIPPVLGLCREEGVQPQGRPHVGGVRQRRYGPGKNVVFISEE